MVLQFTFLFSFFLINKTKTTKKRKKTNPMKTLTSNNSVAQ